MSDQHLLHELPPTDDGSLCEFSVDVKQQQISLEASCPLAGYPTWMRIHGEFTGVVYLAFVNDNPIFLHSENGIDRFEELPEPNFETYFEDLASVQAALDSNRSLLALDKRKGWEFLVTDFGTKTIGVPGRPAPRLRQFVIDSSSFSAKWLCQSATFKLLPDPA